MAKRYLLVAISATFLTLAVSQDIHAQAVPARIFGSGAFNSGNFTFSGQANGNHLGNCSFAGSTTLIPLDPTGLYLGYIAPDVYTAANGDTLELLGVGTVTLTQVAETSSGEPIYTAIWDGTWTVVPTSEGGQNTGRFINTTGSYELTAENSPFAFSDPFWYLTFEKIGELDLGRKGRKK